MRKKVIFSGVQPSGNLHLGNYLGAIKNWVSMQENFDTIFCIVDLHAITNPQNPHELRKKTIEVTKLYLALGINPEKSIIFAQSGVSAHSELMWLLGTIVKMSELQKMTQFKDKSNKQNRDGILAGILNYPILMTSDILLYDTSLVPVGQDQTQHIELARTIARRFNKKFEELFFIPKPYIKKEGMRIMGLDDPSKKMSKSAPSSFNRIELTDSPDQIQEKIKRAITDDKNQINYSDDQPGIKNLINIFSCIKNKTPQQIEADYKKTDYKKFKEDLIQSLSEFLAPFQKKFHEISDAEAISILEKGQKQALVRANKKLDLVKKAMGFIN